LIDWRIGGRRQSEEVVPRRFGCGRSANQAEGAGFIFGSSGDIRASGFGPIISGHRAIPVLELIGCDPEFRSKKAPLPWLRHPG